jgi:hypothetical protein
MQMPTLKVLLAFGILLWMSAHDSRAQEIKSAPLNVDERAELDIYRRTFPQLRDRLELLEANHDSAKTSSLPYTDYISRFYGQQADLGDLTVRAFRWQLYASNVVLLLVVAIAISGIAFSAYQLWISARLAIDSHEILRGSDRRHSHGAESDLSQLSTLEISTGRIRIQTAFVGILVLIISAALLILFVHEVYKINVVQPRPAVERDGASPLKSKVLPQQ